MINLLLFFAPIILTWDHPGGLELQGFKIYSGPTMTSLEHVETLEKDAREYSFEHPGDETKCFAISSRNLSGESERATKVGDDDLCLGKPLPPVGLSLSAQ